MSLATIAAGSANVSVQDFAGQPRLAKEIQSRLITLGCLDPPADGSVGPVTKLSLATFAGTLKLPYPQALTPAIAQALLRQTPETFLPWTFGNDLGSRLVRFMLANNFFVARLPDFLTIVYLEGANADGRPNPDAPNQFNDRRIVLKRLGSGRPKVLLNVVATTEPGRFYTEHPLNPQGAARIAFGQYKAWRVGFHRANQTPPRKHLALVQVASITVHRDANKDGKRTGDRTFTGDGFGINQHHAHDAPVGNIGKHGAGCLVGRSKTEHQAFMTLVKTDRRYAATNGYTYLTTVLNGDHFGAFG